MQTPNKIALCLKGKCCPTIEIIDNNWVLITDDFGGMVRIKKEQAVLFGEKLKELVKHDNMMN